MPERPKIPTTKIAEITKGIPWILRSPGQGTKHRKESTGKKQRRRTEEKRREGTEKQRSTEKRPKIPTTKIGGNHKTKFNF